MRKGAMAALAAVLLAAGCSPRVDVRGNMPDDESIAVIALGETKRDEVIRLLGNPSTSGTFEKETWYYIGQRTETQAFFHPSVVDQKVLLVRFDKDGTVEEIQKFDMKDGKPVEVVDRVTPTRGKDLTILQQLVGNLGRFGSSGSPLTPTGSGGDN